MTRQSSPVLAPGRVVVVAARNEEERIGAALRALASTMPGARMYVADDASTDRTPELAREGGAEVVRADRHRGKGACVTAAAEAALAACGGVDPVVVLCDADLGATAGRLEPLAAAVQSGQCDLAIGSFALRVGGGFGLVVRSARGAMSAAGGPELAAPVSGQRALRASSLAAMLPLAAGYGLEAGMNLDAARLGLRVREYELDLAHRATGRSPAGFAHRARQLRDVRRAIRARRPAGG